ncbi:porin family protein [Saprospiraceae bacterium]|nr:porin family protein [Saprospiraceae bacterium]
MKQTLLTVALCLSFFYTHAQLVTPQPEPLKYKKWNFGLQSSFLADFDGKTTYRLGMFSEYRINERFSIEADVNLSHTRVNNSNFLLYESADLDVALSAKYRLGRDKSWFLKLGYYQTHNIWNNAAERFNEVFPSQSLPEGQKFSIRDGLQLGVGKDFNLTNGRAISVEGILRRVGKEYEGGIKLGLRF